MADGGDTSGLLSFINMAQVENEREKWAAFFCKCLDLVFAWRINYTITKSPTGNQTKVHVWKAGAASARALAHKQNMLLTQIQWSGARTTTTVSDRRCLFGAKVLINSGERRTTMCTIGVIGLRHLCRVHNRRRRHAVKSVDFVQSHSIGRGRHAASVSNNRCEHVNMENIWACLWALNNIH